LGNACNVKTNGWSFDANSEQMTWKNKKLKKIVPNAKNHLPPIYGSLRVCDQKGKGCLYKVGMNRLKSYRSSILLLEKINLQKIVRSNSNSLLSTYPTTGEICHQYLPTISAQLLLNLNESFI